MRTIGVERLRPGDSHPGSRAVPVEMPVAISFLGLGYAVMMATPTDLEDFAAGFALSERLIDDVGQLGDISITPADAGLLLNIELADECHDRMLARVRHRVGDSSCGLCGIENLGQALRPLPRVARPDRIEPAMLFASLAALRAQQPLDRATGAAHAAALFDSAGALIAAREDVGRHNAFDKLIGHCLRTRLCFANRFALLTSRCSYELVEKAALAGIGLLVTVSAPTSLAVDRAIEAGLTLVALARSDEMLIVADPQGLFGGSVGKGAR